jgi:sarcosine oxidase
MNQSYDVVLVGLGAMGSAAAYHVARRGLRVLGLDRFAPPHEQGSSHGQTRIIREAYFEHPLYVPLVQRAYELWDELEQTTGRELLRRTGGLMIGAVDSELVQGAQRSAQIHKLDCAVLTGAEVQQRFPVLQPAEELVGVWEPRAGVLFPEACIAAHLELARQNGARFKFDEPITSWQADETGVRVTTTLHQYRARRMILTAGAWLGDLVPELALPLAVERQVLFWFQPTASANAFHPDRCPVYIWEYEPNRHFYGFPDMGRGVKVAIGFHRDYEQVLIASPCSGHGFKFSSAIGEALADLLTNGQTSFDTSLFRLGRFTPKR